MDQTPEKLVGIKEVFYQTRVLMGREYTLKRFAKEIMLSTVEPVMLSYIEKGKRFPTEAQVERLAVVRGEESRSLLVILWQDRMLYAFLRELQKALKGKDTFEIEGLGKVTVASLVSRAIAALSDDGAWVPLQRWQAELNRDILLLGEKRPHGLLSALMRVLKEQGLLEVEGNKIRRLGRHYVAGDEDEKSALANEFCGIFSKSLLGKVVLEDKQTYLRNHFLHIPEENISDFHQELDEAVKQLVQKYAIDEGSSKKLLNVLISSTSF